MANFVSSLTGQQINDVMTKIEQGVPEGYAVGEKNGVPVSSSSVYYHNNAKYYAESAQGSAARAEAAVPASTAGAVFFDRSQSLTEAQKGQAKANIGAGSSNPNLLVNWWWGTGVVNSRGITSGTNFSYGTYRMDRWYTSFGTSANVGSWELTDDGLILTTTTSPEYFGQRLPFALTNQTVTVSVMFPSGEIVSNTALIDASQKNVGLITGMSFMIKGYDEFFIYAGQNRTFTIKAIKLELGNVSTLAYDTKPNPHAEYIRCITSPTVTPTDNYVNKVVTATPNPNLLDNAWFGNGKRVNQRGTTSYPSVSTATYCIDRWLYNRATVTLTDYGIAFAWNGVDSNSGNIQQFTSRDLRNNLLTCSAVIGGNLYSATMYFGTGTVTKSFEIEGKLWTWQIDYTAGVQSGVQSTRLVLFSTDTTARTIEKMKLEIGPTSTLLLDAPPHYTETLAKCQRFFVRVKSVGDDGLYPVGFGRINGDGTTARIAIPVPAQMRAKPTIAINGTYNLACNGTNTALTGLTAFATTAGSVIVTATGTFSANHPCILSTSSVNNYLNFSADI